MSKNLIPLVIVLGVIVILVGGVLLLSNSKSQKKDPFDIFQTINSTTSVTPPQNAIITPSPKVKINMDNLIATASGLQMKDEVVGTGTEAQSGNTVTVNYLGTLQDGTKFDSSYDRKTPFTTQIGVGQVIKGWDEGIVGMKVGGKRVLVIPSSLGYGEQDMGAIPPNSTLVFEVELLDVK